MLRRFKPRNVWRVASLVLILVALMGPWWFDRIFVPAEYICNGPAVRLEGDFCGIPMPGTSIIIGLVSRSIELSVDLVRGSNAIRGTGSDLLSILPFSLLALLLVLPFFSTLFLILRGDNRRRQLFQIAAWVLAAGVGLLFGIINSRLKVSWILWGIWLYIGIAAAALIVEVLTFANDRRPNRV
jgi:hypothetical protein